MNFEKLVNRDVHLTPFILAHDIPRHAPHPGRFDYVGESPQIANMASDWGTQTKKITLLANMKETYYNLSSDHNAKPVLQRLDTGCN